LCNTEEACLRLIETCEQQGVTLMCAYPVRYRPGIVKLKAYLDSGEYGKVFTIIWEVEKFFPNVQIILATTL
jgi:predicted dehydrogenase